MDKINPIDRVQALKRSSMYAADYKAYSKEYKEHCPKHVYPSGPIPDNIDVIRIIPSLSQTKKKDASFTLSDSSKKLCHKYDLRFPIEPNTPYHESNLLRLQSPISYFHPRELVDKLRKAYPDGIKDFNLLGKELISYMSDRIMVMIDTTFPRDMIRDEFEKIMHEYSKPSKERMKANTVDIWRVHDMKQIGKKSLNQISKELLGSNGQPAYDNDDDKKYKVIKRAYEKARRIIDTIEKHAETKK